jgi:MtrB/PioB family decaheme-associated outer membrane protein
MRRSAIPLLIALVVIPATTRAQTMPGGETTGVIDVGVRGTALNGDAARYERYRDLGDGLFLQRLQVNREANGWFLDLSGDNVGRRDQRFQGDFVKPGKFKGFAMWDQIPMLISRTTRTLFVENISAEPNMLTIDDAIQAQTQANPASIVNLFNTLSVPFDTKSRRNRAQGGFEYLATPEFTVRTNIQFTDREGTLPYGGSFGHSSLVEFPAPIRHTLTDVQGNAEYSRNAILLRAGYTGSFFHNDATTAIFENPFRLTDLSTAPSRGQLSLAPSSSFVTVNGMASVRLAHRTRATAYVSVGTLKDAGDPLMPQTVNTANLTAPIERNYVEGEARTTGVTLTFTSRPNRYLDVNVNYRSYDYDNRTPVFSMTQRVSYDNAPSNLASPVHSEPFGVVRGTLDADVRVLPVPGVSAGVGYSRVHEKRNLRIFESTTDNVMRATVDSFSTGMFSLRTKYEHAERRGEGIEHGEAELIEIGEHPGMRHFDVAPRDRDRVTIVGTLTPTGTFSLNGSIAAGKDDYRLELPRTGLPLEDLFGLRDNSHRVYTAGLDAVPTDRVTVGGSYSFERYNALSRSRQATRAVEQFENPRRNWAAEGTDRVHSIIVTGGITQIAEKLDLQLSYDYNRARARYEYFAGAVPDRTLPEESVVERELPPPSALPLVRSELGRGSADLTYALTSRVAVGVSYWYEQFRVADFTLDAEANPVLARGAPAAVLLGYLYRPYTANTFWGRLIYRW